MPSLCTALHTQAFFTNGTFPPKDLVCKPDVFPFPQHNVAISRFSDEEGVILANIAAVHRVFLNARS